MRWLSGQEGASGGDSGGEDAAPALSPVVVAPEGGCCAWIFRASRRNWMLSLSTLSTSARALARNECVSDTPATYARRAIAALTTASARSRRALSALSRLLTAYTIARTPASV